MWSAADDIKLELANIADDIARKLNLSNYNIDLNLSANRGDGFLSELYKISIADEDNTKVRAAIKRAPIDEARREALAVEQAYGTEIYFYSSLFPVLDQFQRKVSNPFNNIPRYLTSVGNPGKEAIALEDITSGGFVMREKDLLLDDQHAKIIFRTYGRLHALTLAFKHQKPEEYEKLIAPLPDALKLLSDRPGFKNSVKESTLRGVKALDPIHDAEIVVKCQEYLENFERNFLAPVDIDDDKYTTILHGDCWLNNMMFKYKDPDTFSGLEDIKLLDFQMVRVGSPVFDLSYFFYTGSRKELFDKLDRYLDLYYESFSAFSQELGSDAQVTFPKEVLRSHWKKYARSGLALWMVILAVKMMPKEAAMKMSQGKKNESSGKSFLSTPYNEKEFNKRARDILVHMAEINAL